VNEGWFTIGSVMVQRIGSTLLEQPGLNDSDAGVTSGVRRTLRSADAEG
jgi:hypothetical protein